MDSSYDLTGIPLECDETKSDLDSSSSLPVTPARTVSDHSLSQSNPESVANCTSFLFQENENMNSNQYNGSNEVGLNNSEGTENDNNRFSVPDLSFSSQSETEHPDVSAENAGALNETNESNKMQSALESSFQISSTMHDNDLTDNITTPIEANCDNENNKVPEEDLQNSRSRTEEEMKLREFDILDEVGPYDDNEYEDDPDSYGDGMYDDYDDDLSEDEIDAMLEEGLEESQPARKKFKKDTEQNKNVENEGGNKEQTGEEKEYTEKEKVVMVEKVKDHFEVLPDGWVTLTHNSGMPLYLHRASRVCTLSKPYFLGPGSARKHAIPLSAVPCFEYRRAKEEEAKRKNENGKSNTLIVNGTEIPNARVETAQENEQSRQLTPLQLREYCQRLFEFETIQVIRFKSWLARRNFTKQRNEKLHQRPTLPKDTKLITCPIRQSNADGKAGRAREWIMNPNGKSYVCILHEYVQRALKDQPVYSFKELENTATPYLAIVSIGNIQYGKGFGSSKKQAKHDAAKNTLEILIPDMKAKIDQDKKLWGRAGNSKGQTDLSFFDGIKIEDPRVTEFCVKTTEPLPHAILLTCLQRNFGLSEMNIKYETTPLKHSKNEFTMTVGNHTAKVICQNKRDGKQKASQAILQALHPHVPSWGSLLRLYGNTSVKTMKEKKIEEQEITLLQSRGTSHSPNYAILNKLKEEMKKFKAMKSAIRPIGKFIPPDDVDLPTESGSDLSNVVL